MRGHDFTRRMNFFTVAGRVRGDFGSLFSRAAGAFEVIANLLAAGTGCVEVFLRVSLDLWGAASPGRDFVTEVAEFVSQLGLVDGRGELLRGKEALRLNGARLAVVPLGDIENDRVGVQLRSDIAVDRAGCVVLELGGDKPARRFGRMVSADAGLCVVFELIEGNPNALPVRFADTLIAADQRCK